METSDGPAGKAKALESVERAVLVLNAFTGRNEWRVTDLARFLGLPKAGAYRIIKTLEICGYLEQLDARGSYALGPAAVALGRSAAGRAMVTTARRHLLRLAEQTGEVVLLYVLRGHRYVCIERLDVNAATTVTVEIGDTMGLHAGAGKSILAYQSSVFIDEVLSSPLSKYSEATPVNPDAVRDILAKVAVSGYWVSEGEITPHTLGISAPVRDPDGQVKYAVCVSANAADMSKDRLSVLSAAVVDTAASISQSLGFRPGADKRSREDA
ncbi:MAG: IclR family transcriptional regulator [Homoserinimonas sp.]